MSLMYRLMYRVGFTPWVTSLRNVRRAWYRLVRA
jgi:hypothetical protein